MISRCKIELVLDEDQISALWESCVDILDLVKMIRVLFAGEIASGAFDDVIESFIVDELLDLEGTDDEHVDSKA